MNRPVVLYDLAAPVEASPEEVELMAIVNGSHPADTRLLVVEDGQMYLTPRCKKSRLRLLGGVVVGFSVLAAAAFLLALIRAVTGPEFPAALLAVGWVNVLVALLHHLIYKKEEPLCLN